MQVYGHYKFQTKKKKIIVLLVNSIKHLQILLIEVTNHQGIKCIKKNLLECSACFNR